MTYLEVVYRYQTPPGEAELRAIDSVREVYGIQRIQFNEKERTVRVLFDASRLKSDAVAKLLRQAGIDVQEQTGSCLKPSGSSEVFDSREFAGTWGENQGGTPPVSRLILNFQEESRGRAAEKLSGVRLRRQTEQMQGAFGRPLAEVFSQMPRCAPLRLP